MGVACRRWLACVRPFESSLVCSLFPSFPPVFIVSISQYPGQGAVSSIA